MQDTQDDCWDVFGSDDDDESTNNHHADSNSPEADKSEMNNLVMEQLSDAIITTATQKFIKHNHDVKIHQRFFGLQDVMTIEKDDGVLKLLNSCLSRKIQQRGMKLVHPMNDDSNGLDGASIAKRFEFQDDGSLKTCCDDSHDDCHESVLRRNLVLGGVLFVTMILEYICCPKRDQLWTAKDLLRSWQIHNSNNDNNNDNNNNPNRTYVFTEGVWDVENAHIIHQSQEICASSSSESAFSVYTLVVRKRPCTVNTQSCIWKTNHKRVPSSFYTLGDERKDETWLDFEHRMLASATISQSVQEQTLGYLTNESIEKAVKAMQIHGFVVLPGLFCHCPHQLNTVRRWSKTVLDDFDRATDILKTKHSVDILNPGTGSDPLSYREMAMREDFRVDLRDGPSMRVIREEMECIDGEILDGLGFKVMSGGEGTAPVVIDVAENATTTVDDDGSNKSKILTSLRYNPFVLDIVRKVLNPHSKGQNSDSTEYPLYKGNFGRWNFSGSGPNGTPQPLRVGKIGSVISLPGAADQCIHADTPHLFEIQDCLPCHYANLFIYGEDNMNQERQTGPDICFDCDGNFTGDNLIGGTAFIDGSHRLSITARLTVDKGISAAGVEETNQNEMHMRIIRPSLQLGDALLFDTRTLHFGLANMSHRSCSSNESGLRRPMLYVNMTHSWFFDPKNWDDKQSIFEECSF